MEDPVSLCFLRPLDPEPAEMDIDDAVPPTPDFLLAGIGLGGVFGVSKAIVVDDVVVDAASRSAMCFLILACLASDAFSKTGQIDDERLISFKKFS
jgi:hypothetical protein